MTIPMTAINFQNAVKVAASIESDHQAIECIDVFSSVSAIKSYLMHLQNRICAFAEGEEATAAFHEDAWSHAGGGGGITRVLAGGQTFEKAGVNFSHVQGAALPQAATTRNPALANAPFQALGVSVVMHPLNPYVPTTHFNVRFIVVEKEGAAPHWWFGGGFDLTPYYGFAEDCVHWHQMAQAACHPFGEGVYQHYKDWADRYFFLKHRNEARGIGGIFFDELNAWGFSRCFDFMQSVSDHYLQAYRPIVQARKQQAYSERERAFQLYRRGRYVEFNLLYDRGTLFGLQSGGRTESILMSLPPLVAWAYDRKAAAGDTTVRGGSGAVVGSAAAMTPVSPEDCLHRDFLAPRDWIG